MTTQEKTTAIKKIVANRDDNRAAVKAAGVAPELTDLLNDAVNQAFQADLEKIFAG
ncbi:MAG: hypothetical protein QOD64_201 [Verrucomicrobiota bacterium]